MSDFDMIIVDKRLDDDDIIVISIKRIRSSPTQNYLVTRCIYIFYLSQMKLSISNKHLLSCLKW